MRILKSVLASLVLVACDSTNFAPSSTTVTSPFENLVRSRDSSNLKKLGPQSDDAKLLSVRLFASAQFEDGVDACKRPPVTHDFVASRLSPFAYCIEGTGRKSPKLQVCLELNDSFAGGEIPDSCWVKTSELEHSVLLSNGKNIVRMHARDGDGHQASDDQEVALDPGFAPEIRLLSPDQAKISAGFTKGATVKLVFQVIDNDTALDKLKLIVQLSNRDGNGNIRPIACNFSNSKQWNICPNGANSNAADFQLNAPLKQFTYNLTIPQDYNTSEPYVLMITAIDQSGNAAITTTGEIGSNWEVVAGRSYKGAGGSGSTIQTDGDRPLPIVDKFGNIYLMSSLDKVSPFDARVCKAFRTTSAPASIADCPDIIVSDFVPANRGWTYDAQQNEFYMVGRLNSSNYHFRVAKVNFRNRKIDILSGDSSKTDILSISYGTSLPFSTVTFSSLETNLYFVAKSRLLYLRAGDFIFVMDERGNVRKVIGNGSTEQDIANQIQVPAIDAKLPKLPSTWEQDVGFIVMDDGRIIMAADRLTTSKSGSGFGRLFAIEGLDVNDHTAMVSVIDLLKRADYQMFTTMIFQPQSQKILATTSWLGLRTLTVPEPMVDPAAAEQQVSRYVIENGDLLLGSATISMSRFLLDEEKRTDFPLPRMLPTYVRGIAYGSSKYLYFGDGISKFLLAYDVTTHKIQPVIGHVDDYNVSDNSMNIRLDYPHSIGKDAQDRIIFADRNGLRRASLVTSSLTYNIETIYETVSEDEFTISPDGSTLVRATDSLRFDVFDLNASKMVPHNHRVDRIYNGGAYFQQSGFRFKSDGSLLMAESMGRWDGFRVQEAAMSLYTLPRPSSWTAAKIVAVIKGLSAADKISTDYPRTGVPNSQVCFANSPNAPYQQGVVAADGSMDTAQFRLCGYTTSSRGGKVTAAFIDDSRFVTCLVNQHYQNGKASIAVVDTANGKIQFTPGMCESRHSVFHVGNGKLYHGYRRQFDEIDLTNFSVKANALVASLPSDAWIRSIFVDAGYAFISDTGSDRVLKVKLK